MAKLIYLYTTGGASCIEPTDHMHDYFYQTTNNRYATAARTDGMVKLFSELPYYSDHIDCTEVFIDSAYDTGLLRYNERCRIHVIPTIWLVRDYIDPGDIVVVRGGFRNWLPVIKHVHELRKNWILFYRANTAHGHWPYWDVTLNDLITKRTVSQYGRVHVPFNKPVNEDIFGYIDSPNQLIRDIDVMVGASHIHSKKGQFNTIKALERFKALYGYQPKAVLVGGYIRCASNSYIMDAVEKPELNIEFIGPVARPQLALLMNRTKVFVHGGIGGQNDRGTLEAAACGCFTVLVNYKSAAPFLHEHACVDNAVNLTALINCTLVDIQHNTPDWAKRAAIYKAKNGMYTVAIPQISEIVDKLHGHYPKTSIIGDLL